MRLEEEFSLKWLGTTSISIATQIDGINKVYIQKVVEKGKAKLTEEEIQS